MFCLLPERQNTEALKWKLFQVGISHQQGFKLHPKQYKMPDERKFYTLRVWMSQWNVYVSLLNKIYHIKSDMLNPSICTFFFLPTHLSLLAFCLWWETGLGLKYVYYIVDLHSILTGLYHTHVFLQTNKKCICLLTDSTLSLENWLNLRGIDYQISAENWMKLIVVVNIANLRSI